MKLIQSKTATVEISEQNLFSCYSLDKKGHLSGPFTLTKLEILKQISEGESFQALYQVGCRWEVGEPLSEPSP